MIELDFFNLTNFNRQRIQRQVMDALAKFDKGDAVDDDELKDLINFFQALEGLCAAMGPTYELVCRNADNKLRTLEGFQRSRKEHANEILSRQEQLKAAEECQNKRFGG